MSKKVAFVVQRCGLEVNGGAELLCRMIAQQMAKRRPTEVLTTCALDYVTWANHYPAGEERIDALTIRRFPVEKPRDIEGFNRLSAELAPRRGTLALADEERWMREQGPWSPALLEYLGSHEADYDAFVFFTYLYASTYFGLPLVRRKAILVPTAHDEWPIYFSMFDRMMALPRSFVFQTPEELEFLRRRFPALRFDGPVLGVAVDPPERVDAQAFRAKYGIEGPFILYAGRIDGNKGVGQLVADFEAYRKLTGDSATQLVLVGKKAMELADAPHVRVLGFVPEQDKWDGIAASEAVMMPSAYESLSIACLEAWTLGKPVLVNAKSEVLKGQARRSQGGLWYSDTDEFCAALEILLREEPVRRVLGAQGADFVNRNYRWPLIMDAYEGAVSALSR